MLEYLRDIPAIIVCIKKRKMSILQFRQHYRAYLYMKIEDITKNNEENKYKFNLWQILFMFDIILHDNI
jgi:hypothetical protein